MQIVIAKCKCSSFAAQKVLEECNGDVIDAVALLRVRALGAGSDERLLRREGAKPAAELAPQVEQTQPVPQTVGLPDPHIAEHQAANATAAGVTNDSDDEDLAGAVDDAVDAATFVSTPREFSTPREHDAVPPPAQPHWSQRTGTAEDGVDERDVFMRWMKEQMKAQQQQTQVLQ